MISFNVKYINLYYIYKSKFITFKYLLIFIIIVILLSNKFLKKNENYLGNQINASNAKSFDNSLINKINGIYYLNKCKRHKLNNIDKITAINIIPKISIIIPVYNCENTIELSVISILNQNFSKFEIILVNDFSTDNSLQIIKRIKKKRQKNKNIK